MLGVVVIYLYSIISFTSEPLILAWIKQQNKNQTLLESKQNFINILKVQLLSPSRFSCHLLHGYSPPAQP